MKNKKRYDDANYDDDNQLYNRYTEVFTKDSKKQAQMTESLFTSGGLLEIMNQRNLLVILNLDNFVYLSPEHVSALKSQSLL